jgi:uncharacterized protein (TIGR02453 family)
MTRVSRDVFAFLAELRRHNNREWFNENKDRYLAEVRDPMLALVASLAPGLARISRHIAVDPRPAGGSLMRIYRDTRFSRDKTPYKTNVGIHFGLKAPRDFEAPGYYLHLEPGSVFMGAGLWHPGADALRSIRDAIVRNPRGWKQARRAGLSHDEATLKRPPRGFDPRPSAHRGPQAPVVHHRSRVRRASGLRAGLSGSFHDGLPPRNAADAIPGQGAGARVLSLALPARPA